MLTCTRIKAEVRAYELNLRVGRIDNLVLGAGAITIVAEPYPVNI